MSDPIPKPIASPTSKDDTSDTPTGKFRVLEADLKKGFRTEKIYTVAVAALALVVSLSSVFGGYRLFLSDARAQTTEQIDAGLTAQQVQITAIKDEQKMLKESQQVVLVEVREMRQDLREAYKSQRYDRPSSRLEAVLPSLVSLDGGR